MAAAATKLRSLMKRADVSHEEIRRVLAESNRRIEEERRTLVRRLHDDLNPQLLLAKMALKQLEPLVKNNEEASALLGQALDMVDLPRFFIPPPFGNWLVLLILFWLPRRPVVGSDIPGRSVA